MNTILKIAMTNWNISWMFRTTKSALFTVLIAGGCIIGAVVLTFDLNVRSPLFNEQYTHERNIEKDAATVLKRTNSEKEDEIPRFFSYLNKGPLNFSTNFKNPCWYDKDTLYCLPYFYVAGFPKSGTTDLHRRIATHKFYVVATHKEPLWMTRRRFHGSDELADDLLYYTTIFRDTAAYLSNPETTAKERMQFITGDCSTNTLWENVNWRRHPGNQGLSEPKYTTSDIVKQLNPNVKIVVILRNPISRLYSDYLYHNHKNLSAENFHERARNAVAVFNNCTRYYSLRYCLYDGYTAGQVQTRLWIGVYHMYIAEWLRVFPREQLFVFKLEEYSPAPEVKMREVFKFLGLDPDEIKKFVPKEKHANANRRGTTVGPMWNKTRELLYEFYKPHNFMLSHLLKDEKFKYGPI